MRAAVIGASGYTGLELVRIVLRHPNLELVAVTSEQRKGEPVGACFPGLEGLVDLDFESATGSDLASRIDVAFTALPHNTAARVCAELHKSGVTVLDISADFRLRDPETYQHWYGDHGAPELFGKGVYGLPEVYRDEIRGASLIAAPGCYPTGALIPMLPFLRAGVVETDTIFVDSKSGVSGAGRSLQDGFLFAELEGNSHAYKVAAHRHVPEIIQEASLAAGEDVGITFIPYLIPATRGIVSSVLMRPKGGARISVEQAHGLLEAAYADEPFVRVVPLGQTPKLQSVRGSNFCDVGVAVDPGNGAIVALSAIDNLVKGSGGQAVQCLNIMKGWDETAGLLEAPLLP